MNRFYGIRIPASFASQESWFALNEHGGKLLGKWSSVIIATGFIGLFVPLKFQVGYLLVSVFVVLLAVIYPAIQILVFAGKKKQS